MPLALKASWEVTAGLIPGTPVPEFTKRWEYTSADYEEDGQRAKDFSYQPIMMKRIAEAGMYHMQLQNPRLLNWSQLTFIWY